MSRPEQRRLGRVGRRFPVNFGTSEPRHLGFIKNLSAQGLAITSRTIFSDQTQLNLSIPSEGEPILAQGVVCWTKDAEPQFVHLSKGSAEMGIWLTERPRRYLDFFQDVIDAFREHRRSPRLDKVLRVTLETPDRVVEEYTKNISLGGMYVVTDEPLNLDTHVEVRITLADAIKVIHAEARVVYALNPDQAAQTGQIPGVGVQFLRFFDQGETVLHEYVEQLLSEGFVG